MLSVIQHALQRLCPGSKMTMDSRRIVSLWYADDGCLLADDLPTLQLGFECVWLTTKMLGLLWQIKGKKKTAWSATWWKDGKEVDVSGYEMKMPDDSIIPQLQGEELYKYLGTEMNTGWHNGKAHARARAKVVTRCRQLIGLLGRVPCLTEQQLGSAISLALSGCIGYYARSTVVTWEDCVKIEQARVGALRAKGITEGVPRRQIYGSPRQAEMGHEHAYAIATAALRDQVDRALCGRKGEPARAIVEEAIAKTCYRLGCRGIHPLEWQPVHLTHELRDDLCIEAYLKGMIQCGWRGKLTAGGRQMSGPLGQDAEWEWTPQRTRTYGPMVWESRQVGGWDSRLSQCTYSRSLARKGITHWAHITNATSCKWLTTGEATAMYGLQGREVGDYESVSKHLDVAQNVEQRDKWFDLVRRGEVCACDMDQQDGDELSGAAREKRLRTGYWELEKIVAARRTATCLGGYEYAVQWVGAGIDWVPHDEMRHDMHTTAAMKMARTRALKPASYGEWLAYTRQTAHVKDARNTCAGRHNLRGWGGVWTLFLKYREACEVRGMRVHARAEDNHSEVPHASGERGTQWTPDAFHTCYLGEPGDKRCSLSTRGAVKPHLEVTDEIIMERQEREWPRMRRRVADGPKTAPPVSGTCTHITEIERILRAGTAFGVLGMPMDAAMGNAQMGLWHTRALGRLNASQEREPGTRQRAEEALEHARVTLMDSETRRHAEDTYQQQVDVDTCTIRCPVDIEALREAADGPAGSTVYKGRTYRDIIEDLLTEVGQ